MCYVLNKILSSDKKASLFERKIKAVKHIAYAANANGFINVCHFSDTFLIYMNYCLRKQGFWLADTKEEPYPLLLGEIGTRQYPIVYGKHPIYLSFLQTCMDFFCQAIVDGIPLRGWIGNNESGQIIILR